MIKYNTSNPDWLDEALTTYLEVAGSNEYGTSPRIIEPLKYAVGGEFDLDPATNKKLTHIAKKYYTKEDDGLDSPWFDRVFVNPPYSREKKKWVAKAREEVKKDRVEFIVFLCRGDSSTDWWHGLFEDASHVCFLDSRMKFIGANSSARFPSHIFVLGDAPSKLLDELDKLGAVKEIPEPKTVVD
jgi:phage N-6-adenine-methyltransferase